MVGRRRLPFTLAPNFLDLFRLTLDGIPAEVYDYRLGTRFALEWVVDQYRVKTDKRSGIMNDPNRETEPRYIVDLIARVITVSLKTMEISGNLPPL